MLKKKYKILIQKGNSAKEKNIDINKKSTGRN
jgi:hypothetical protein